MTSDNQTRRLAEGNAAQRSPQPRLGHLLSQGSAAGLIISFLFVAAQMFFVRKPYNFLFIPALPIVLFYGLLVGSFKAFIIWVCTKLFMRRLWVVSRVGITLLMFGLLVAIWWWQWFSKPPMRADYYSGSSPSAITFLLTRSSLVHSAFLTIKKELRYYLID